MMERLWGNNFFDPATRRWTKRHTGSETCKRGFVQFVYAPIKEVIDAAMANDKQQLFSLCEKLRIADRIKSQDRDKAGKELLKAVMQAWLPAQEVRSHSKKLRNGSSLGKHLFCDAATTPRPWPLPPMHANVAFPSWL